MNRKINYVGKDPLPVKSCKVIVYYVENNESKVDFGYLMVRGHYYFDKIQQGAGDFKNVFAWEYLPEPIPAVWY